MRRLWRIYAQAYSGLPGKIWFLCFITLINRAGTMVLPFLVLFLTTEQGFSSNQAAWLLLSFGLGSVLGSYQGGKWCASLGPSRVILASLILGGLSFPAFLLLHGLPSVLLGCFVMGFCNDAFRPGAMTQIADWCEPETRARAFALLRLAMNLGIAIGPAVGGFLATWDYRLIFWGDGLTCLVAGLLYVPLMLSERGQSQSEDKVTGPTRDPRKDKVFLGFMAMVLGLYIVIYQLASTYPLFLKQNYGLGEERIGLLFTFNAIIVVSLEMVLVKRLEHGNLLRLFGIGCAILCLSFALLPFGSSYAFVLFAMAVFAVGEMLSLPFSNTLVAIRAGSESGPYMGVYTAVTSTGLIIGPPLGLYLFGSIGGDGLWYSVGAAGLLILLGCLFLEQWWPQTETEVDRLRNEPSAQPMTRIPQRTRDE